MCVSINVVVLRTDYGCLTTAVLQVGGGELLLAASGE